MCSILGVSFVPGSTINRRKLASALLEAGEVRGTDASGYGWVSPTGDGVYKNNVPGRHLHVGKIPVDASAMILHTRASTHGSPKDMENNHPVVSPQGTIRLVHNGVVYNHQAIRTLLGKTGKMLPDVDSAVIPAIIEEWGLDMTSELSGYASAAWFDTETDNTIHLARFKTSTISYATLWDGSLVFASTASILAKALTAAGLAWLGSYPEPFESIKEGEYVQILDGEFILEGTVDWKKDYAYSGRNWSAQTSGGQSASTTNTGTGFTPKSAIPLPTTASSTSADGRTIQGKGSEDAPKGLVVVNRNVTDDEAADESVREFLSGSLSGEDYAELFGAGDPDMEEVEDLSEGVVYQDDDADGSDVPEWYRPMAFVTGDTRGFFYANSHDGDFQNYPSLAALVIALQWHAGISVGENYLAGPDEMFVGSTTSLMLG